MNEVKQIREGDSMWTVLKGHVYNISPYMRFHTGGETFSLYLLLCRHAKIKTIPNQHRTDEELTTYSHSTFHEQSYAAKTKKWLELLLVLFALLRGFKFILKCVRYLLLTLTLDMRILLTLRFLL